MRETESYECSCSSSNTCEEHLNGVGPTIVEANIMCFVGGSKTSFRCLCGCNIFNRLSNEHYRCNVCDNEYRGE